MSDRTRADRSSGDSSARADPLSGDPRVAEFFGPAFAQVDAFYDLLATHGVERGLIGPRETTRLWERHLLNSAAVAQHLPGVGRLVDVGSGAGLPGIVLAAMLPDVEVILLEPMERRTRWLDEAIRHLGLGNTTVVRGRAEEQRGVLEAEAVTARAVAPMDRLARWCLPLLAPQGRLVVLKGRSAAEELASARKVLRRLGGDAGEVLAAPTIEGVDGATVVRIMRHTVR